MFAEDMTDEQFTEAVERVLVSNLGAWEACEHSAARFMRMAGITWRDSRTPDNWHDAIASACESYIDRLPAAVELRRVTAAIRERLEYIRGEIRAERVSYSEIAELQEYADLIAPDDAELLQWAGVAEHTEEED